MNLTNRIFLILFVLLFALVPGVSALNMVDSAVNDTWDRDSQSFRFTLVSSELGWDVAEETSLTNTVHPLVTFTHTTDDTPAAGIGLSLDWYQETAAANTELGARIAIVTSDVTAASEDFGINWMLMAAGATPATKMSLGSTGILTLVSGATFDNIASATELVIAETNIQLTGIIDLEGGAVTVNDDSGDYDFTVESNGNAAAIFVDAGNNRVGIFTAGPTVPFEVTGESLFTGAMTITGDVAVDTDVLAIDTTNDIVEVNGWYDNPYLEVTTDSYTVTSDSKANYYVINYTDTGAVNFCLDTDVTVDGRVLTIKDGELNANNHNITITTEGSETIDEANTYVLNAAGESVTLLSDGTNWFVMSAYGE
jgi:hypothetical protein